MEKRLCPLTGHIVCLVPEDDSKTPNTNTKISKCPLKKDGKCTGYFSACCQL